VLVGFDPEIRQGHNSPVSKHSWVSLVSRRPFGIRTNDIDIGVGSGSAIVLVGVGESIRDLDSELGLGADASETPWGVLPKWVHEYYRMAQELKVFTEW